MIKNTMLKFASSTTTRVLPPFDMKSPIKVWLVDSGEQSLSRVVGKFEIKSTILNMTIHSAKHIPDLIKELQSKQKEFPSFRSSFDEKECVLKLYNSLRYELGVEQLLIKLGSHYDKDVGENLSRDLKNNE